MIAQYYKLNLIPTGKDPVIVRCSQYDKDSRVIEFSLFNGNEPFALSDSYSVTVRGTKQDGTVFEYNCSVVDTNAVFSVKQQMTLFAGKCPCELRIIAGDEILGSANFYLYIEKSPVDEEAVPSESDLPAYEKLLSETQSQNVSDWLEENISQETGYVIDTSLSVSGAAADAKAVGDEIQRLEAEIEDSGSGDNTGLTDEVINALLACFQNVEWINDDSQTYYDALVTALANSGAVYYRVTNTLTRCSNSNRSTSIKEGKAYTATIIADDDYVLTSVTVTMGGDDVTNVSYSGGTISIPNVTGDIVITAIATQRTASLTSISASFNQGSAVIYTDDSIETLRQYLVVTAHYDDSSTAAVTGYTLSGTLVEGTSTITVTYSGKTTTFTVTVTSAGLLYNWDFKTSLTDTVSGQTAILDGNVTRTSAGLVFTAALDNVLCGTNVMARNRTIEIDFGTMDSKFDSTAVNGIFFWINQTPTHGFGWAQNKDAFGGFWNTAWNTLSNISDLNYFSGSTFKMTISSNGDPTYYKDGVQIGGSTSNNNRVQEADTALLLGSTTSQYPAFYDMIIEAVRIYEGVV